MGFSLILWAANSLTNSDGRHSLDGSPPAKEIISGLESNLNISRMALPDKSFKFGGIFYE